MKTAYGDLSPFLFWFFGALLALCLVVGVFGLWVAVPGYVPAEQVLTQPTIEAGEAATEAAEQAEVAAETNPETPSPILTALFTEDQATEGQEIYAARCAMCHGAEPNEGVAAPPLAGPDFQQKWQDQPIGALYAYTHDNMPLDAPASLTDEEYAAVVAYVLSANGFEAGDTELPASSSTEAILDFGAVASSEGAAEGADQGTQSPAETAPATGEGAPEDAAPAEAPTN